MKKSILTLFLLSCYLLAFPQSKADSLLQIISSSSSKKEKANTYYQLVRHFADKDDNKALEYADLALEMAKDCQCIKEEYDILIEKGIILQTIYQLEKADAVYQSILGRQDYFSEVIKLEKVYMQYGSLFYRKAEYTIAIDYYEKAIEIAKQNDNHKTQGGLYCNIGVIYHSQENYDKAKKYYFLAIEQLKQDGDSGFLANIYNNLAKIVGDKGGDLEQGLSLLDSAFTIWQTKGATNQMAGILGSKADLYSYWDMHEETIRHSKMALEYLEEDSAQKGMQLGSIFSSYLKLGQYEKALKYGEQAVAILDKTNGEVRIMTAMHENLVRAYTHVNDGENARKHFEIALALSDSLYSESNQSVSEELDVKYETEKKEKEIAQQKLQIAKQKNSRNKILLGAGALFLFATFLFQAFYFRQKRKKQATEMALIEKQKEAEKFRELDQLKSTFFTNISHELRTPLTLVSAPLNDALQQVKPSPIKNNLELAYSNTQKLLGLVNEILDLSKLEAGKVEARLSEENLLELIRRIFFSFESITQVRGLQLVFNTNISKDLIVNLDLEKFEKILNNLLSNAVKFTEKGGSITLNAQQEKGQLQIEVIDTGIGIKKEDLAKVFDRFYQSSSENTPLQGGTGIGLSLAKELAQLLQGDLNVESTLNEGSRFILDLPLAAVGDNQHLSRDQRQEETIIEHTANKTEAGYIPILLNGQKPRVLIVEDNLEMSDYLFKSLSNEYQCTKAYDGLEALELMKQQSFDLITCDVMMPNLDGFSFREKLIAQESWRQIPFVMLTARAMEADKLKGLRLGVDDYLTKPFNLKEVKARFHNLLSNKIARDDFSKEEITEDEKPLSHNEQLIKDAEDYILKRIDDPLLRVEDLAKALHLSTRHLSRTMTKLTGISPVNFILEVRLQKARQLLESRKFMTVSEVRYEIGIESASYFSKKFTQRFGKTPKEYLA